MSEAAQAGRSRYAIGKFFIALWPMVDFGDGPMATIAFPSQSVGIRLEGTPSNL
jgi:hypothetical protein